MITGILLAAGAATRFGSQKLLARLPDGRRMVETSATNVLTACAGNVVAVTRRDDELIEVLESTGCRIVINEHAEQGMGTSIAVGVAASADATGWLIALGDMPWIRVDTVATLVDALRESGGTKIVVPVFSGQRGHPVGFTGNYRARLQSLTGDSGAREILKSNAKFVEEISVDDAGIFADVDTRADLER